MAATFAFYVRNSHVSYTGFVRSHHPEIASWPNYRADWQRRNAVASGAENIRRSVRRYEFMDMISRHKRDSHPVRENMAAFELDGRPLSSRRF
jgi:hypothetical protein